MNDNISETLTPAGKSVNILIVEDDEATRSGLVNFIDLEGYNFFEASNIKDALSVFNNPDTDIDIIVTDLKLPDGAGTFFLKGMNDGTLRKADVVIQTGFSSVRSAVEAIKLGAFDYITKPVNLDELGLIIKRIISNRRLIEEITSLKTRLDERFNFGKLVTSSKRMIDVINKAIAVAGTNSTVLIEGDSGTGKELLADIIVNNSKRKDKPFIKVNCAALSESLLESELFGHEKGAYTGADSLYRGRFEIAGGGTIFLDEIGEMPLKTQAKILRTLQEKEFERVGGNKTIKTDIRIIAASQNIEGKVKSGEFRQDLYFRLNVINLKLIPLRERKEDIPLLINKFLEDFSREGGSGNFVLDRKAIELLLNYDYPGNVRELKNIMEYMTAVSGAAPETGAQKERFLDQSFFPEYIKGKFGLSNAEEEIKAGPANSGRVEDSIIIKAGTTLEEAESIIIKKTLELNDYDKVKTAKDLDIGLKTVYRKLAQNEEHKDAAQ